MKNLRFGIEYADHGTMRSRVLAQPGSDRFLRTFS